MSIKIELLAKEISELICSKINSLEIDTENIAEGTALDMLMQIQEIIKNENLSDFDAIEEIVKVFEENEISFGARHDF